MLEAFASSAATAVATGRNVAEQRLRRGIEASEDERRRWARELHDETLQDMASLKLILSSARRSRDPEVVGDILNQAIEQITAGIASLRRLINDLRPPVLDSAGVRPALESLVARFASSNPIDVHLQVDLAYARGTEPTRLHPQVEDTLYRVVQEALTNVLKHAAASSVVVSVVERGDHVELLVKDNGVGIDPAERELGGVGLRGIRERVELVEGSFAIGEGDGGGTELRASIPAVRQEERALPGG
jgi:signal transduction histidine kinase